jgi:hypothetical protein
MTQVLENSLRSYAIPVIPGRPGVDKQFVAAPAQPYEAVHVNGDPITPDDVVEALAAESGGVGLNPNGVVIEPFTARKASEVLGDMDSVQHEQVDAPHSAAAHEQASAEDIDRKAVVTALQRALGHESGISPSLRATARLVLHDLDVIAAHHGLHSGEYRQRLDEAHTIAVTTVRDPREVAEYAVANARRRTV